MSVRSRSSIRKIRGVRRGLPLRSVLPPVTGAEAAMITTSRRTCHSVTDGRPGNRASPYSHGLTPARPTSRLGTPVVSPIETRLAKQRSGRSWLSAATGAFGTGRSEGDQRGMGACRFSNGLRRCLLIRPSGPGAPCCSGRGRRTDPWDRNPPHRGPGDSRPHPHAGAVKTRASQAPTVTWREPSGAHGRRGWPFSPEPGITLREVLDCRQGHPPTHQPRGSTNPRTPKHLT
jgi:hypothetical protein